MLFFTDSAHQFFALLNLLYSPKKHGTVSGANTYYCTCVDCRKARREVDARYRNKKRLARS